MTRTNNYLQNNLQKKKKKKKQIKKKRKKNKIKFFVPYIKVLN